MWTQVPLEDSKGLRQAVARAQRRASWCYKIPTFLSFIACVALTYYWWIKCDGCKPSKVWNDISQEVAKQKIPAENDIGQFIYTYDLGTEYTDDILKLEPDWHSVQYDAENVFTVLIRKSNLYRTTDPEKASLFFVPFYSARFTLFHFKDALINMDRAVEKTSKMWGDILTKVRHDYPYFNRTNGKDHFSFLTLDHGRCTALTFLNPSVVGEMFFLQLNGDKMVRSNHANTTRGMQALTYNYGTLPNMNFPDIPCYMPDRDIVIPPLAYLPTKDPRMVVKNMTALFRFSPGQHHGIPIPHHGHQIRKELYKLWEGRNIHGWSFAVKSEARTAEEWPLSTFCIAPPGHSQWTSRPLKSFLSGCIPVTFFREHDNPWQEEIDYSKISINIDPDELYTLRDRIDTVLSYPDSVKSMQDAIVEIQDYFRWSGNLSEGVESHIIHALQQRARKIRH